MRMVQVGIKTHPCLSHLLLISRVSKIVGFLFLGVVVRNGCICYSDSSWFSLVLYGTTQSESLRLETPLLVLDPCLQFRFGNCTDICRTE